MSQIGIKIINQSGKTLAVQHGEEEVNLVYGRECGCAGKDIRVKKEYSIRSPHKNNK